MCSVVYEIHYKKRKSFTFWGYHSDYSSREKADRLLKYLRNKRADYNWKIIIESEKKS